MTSSININIYPHLMKTLLTLLLTVSTAFAEPQRGLHVEADGTLTLAGKPFHGMGLCYYDGFLRTIRNAKYPSYAPALKKTSAASTR
jgi:hypothetical protein